MLEPNISWKVFRRDWSVTPECLFLWIHTPGEILPGCSLCTFAFTIRQFNDFREVNMRNSWDIGPSEELVAADECCEVLWHRAKTPLKKYDKGKIKIKVTNNCRVYLERPYWFLSIVKLRIYICQMNKKCAFKSLAALYHRASSVGFKRSWREEGYCVYALLSLLSCWLP